MGIAELVLEYIRVLIWPCVLVFVSWKFKDQVTGIFERLKSAKLPGGVSLELNNKIQEVQELSTKVQESVSEKKKEHRDKPPIPLNEVNTRLIELGLRPTPSGMDMDYYRHFAEVNPNLSLTLLRLEVEIMVENLARGFKIDFEGKRYGLGRLLRKLLDSSSITGSQFQLVTKILSLGNKAAHGVPMTQQQALSILDSADVLVDDYLSWLSWGFDDGWKPEG